MANRNDSDARQHETLPGPGPGSNSPITSGSGGRPVEQMMDAAVERIAREQDGSFDLARRHVGASPLARRESALAAPREPTRLRWKGHDVSEEFRQYAERVARGEELPPFEGRVLAEPNPAFPWGDEVGSEEPSKKRSSHPMIWAGAVIVLGLLGWSVASRLDGEARSALVETRVAPLAARDLAPAASATPHDVVETTPAPAATTAADPPEAVSSTPEASSGEARPAPRTAEPAPAVSSLGSAPAPAPPSPPPPAAKPAVSVDLSRAGALQQAVGAALANRSGTGSGGPAGATVNQAPPLDEFGIMTSVNAAPIASTPAPVPPVPSPAPVGAKSNGNVGDLARAGQSSSPGVRKEPGSESSAKGSLLIETPSF